MPLMTIQVIIWFTALDFSSAVVRQTSEDSKRMKEYVFLNSPKRWFVYVRLILTNRIINFCHCVLHLHQPMINTLKCWQNWLQSMTKETQKVYHTALYFSQKNFTKGFQKVGKFKEVSIILNRCNLVNM